MQGEDLARAFDGASQSWQTRRPRLSFFGDNAEWIPLFGYPAGLKPDTGEIGMVVTLSADGGIKKIVRRIFCP